MQPKRRQTAACRYCGRTHPATAQFWYRNHTPENGPPIELEQAGAEGEILHLLSRCKVCEAEYRSELAGDAPKRFALHVEVGLTTLVE